MALRDDIADALEAPIDFVMEELGVPIKVSRQTQDAARWPSGGARIRGERVVIPETYQIVLIQQGRGVLQKAYGIETTATAQGLVDKDAGIKTGDFLCPQDGDLAGQWFEVLDDAPIDMGRISALPLRQTATPLEDL